jgi:phosphate transport system protein
MRQQFQEELNEIREQLVEMTRLVGSAMTRASTALLDADVTLAESVIAQDQEVDRIHHDLEEKAVDLLARQQPVATDLRLVVTSLRMSADLERMGDLARHLAKIARLRFPDSAVPAGLRGTIVEMSGVATRMVAKTGDVIATRDVQKAREHERDDDAMDQLHRGLFAALLDDKRAHGIEEAIDVTLIGRYYERYADHAVSVARRLVYLVTGEYATEDGLSKAL